MAPELLPIKVAFATTLIFGVAGCQKPASSESTPAKPDTPGISVSAPAPLVPGDAPHPNNDGRVPAAKELLERLAAMESIQQEGLAKGVAESLSVKEQEALAVELSRLPVTATRDALLGAVLTSLSSHDPRLALELTLAGESQKGPSALTARMASLWAQTDYSGLYRFAKAMPRGPVREKIELIALRSWSDRDPMDAFRHLATLKYDDGGRLIGVPTKRLSAKDTEAAFQALDVIEDPRVWNAAAGVAFEAVARKDPHQGAELFFEQKDPEVAVALAYALGKVFSLTSVSEGIETLNKIQNPRAADMFIHGMIQSLGKQDMAPLLENVSLIQNPDFRAIAAESTARDLSKKFPDRAVQWIATLPDEEARARAFQGTARGFAENDAAKAEQWIASLPAGKDRRYAVFGFAEQTADKAPANAAAWAMKISENDVRQRLLRVVLAYWNRSDPSAAKKWASESGNQNLLPQ